MPHAIMILVGAVEHVFIAKGRIAPRHLRDDVHRWIDEAIERELHARRLAALLQCGQGGTPEDQHGNRQRRHTKAATGRSSTAAAPGTRRRHRRQRVAEILSAHRRAGDRQEIRLEARIDDEEGRATTSRLRGDPAVEDQALETHGDLRLRSWAAPGRHVAECRHISGRQPRDDDLPAGAPVGHGPVAQHGDRCLERGGRSARDDEVGRKAQAMGADDDRALLRLRRPAQRKELEVRSVIAGRLQSRFACALGDPHRCAHFVECPAFAPPHSIAGQREQVAAEILRGDPIEARRSRSVGGRRARGR
jgi:hypothetical protein